jgi:hypothetical protein|tara:strand:- start:237 stop:422 length:186 start_codon:yes stop_codon:yes gene_type:complete
MAKWTVDGILNAQSENNALKSKVAKQRTEIARLTQALEKVTSEKLLLTKDLKWMRGEEDGS